MGLESNLGRTHFLCQASEKNQFFLLQRFDCSKICARKKIGFLSLALLRKVSNLEQEGLLAAFERIPESCHTSRGINRSRAILFVFRPVEYAKNPKPIGSGLFCVFRFDVKDYQLIIALQLVGERPPE
jgi:hypothetical protein